MCYSLLPVVLKTFDVICQLADDFYEKRMSLHITVAFYSSKSVRDFSLLALNNVQAAVFRQRSNIFQQSR